MALKHLYIGGELPTPAMEGIIDTIKGMFAGSSVDTQNKLEDEMEKNSRNVDVSTYKKHATELMKLIREKYYDDSWINKNIKDGSKTMGSFKNSNCLSSGGTTEGTTKSFTDPKAILVSLKKAKADLDKALDVCAPSIKKRASMVEALYIAGDRTHDMTELDEIARDLLKENPGLKAGVYKNYKLTQIKDIPSLRHPLFSLNRYKTDYDWQANNSNSHTEFDVWPKARCKDYASDVLELIEFSVEVVKKMEEVSDEYSFNRMKHWDPEDKTGLKNFLKVIPMHAGGMEMNTMYWLFARVCADIVRGFYYYMFTARTSVK